MRDITRIIVHHSASAYGCVSVFRGWHIHERGFRDVSYHCVIDNGYLSWNAPYDARMDGAIEIGRPWYQVGAHVKGHNADTIGICLVGTGQFTVKQLDALKRVILDLSAIFGPLPILGHRDLAQTECPGMDIQAWCLTQGIRP